jgi:hypothetical protein
MEIVPLAGLTPFVHIGDTFAWGCALATLLALWIGSTGARRDDG